MKERLPVSWFTEFKREKDIFDQTLESPLPLTSKKPLDREKREPRKASELEGMLRVSKAAEILDVDISTIYKLARRGELRSQRIGKRGIRIFVSSIHQFQQRFLKGA